MNSKSRGFIILFIISINTANAQPMRNTVKGNNIFAFELFKKIYKPEKNIFLSPYSISSALAMTYAGARNETENQMKAVLHFDANQQNCHKGFYEINTQIQRFKNDTTINLAVANALWKKNNYEFKPDFLELTKKYYDASIFQLSNAKTINEWAEKNTNGKIKNVVSDKDLKNTALVLTNAIYFKGTWRKLFKEKDTRKDSFMTEKNKNVAVEMMYQLNQVMYFEDEQNQVIELPYKGDSIVMTIILPKPASSVSKLVNQIDYKWFSYYLSNLTLTDVFIHIPKFTFNSSFELSNTLKNSGMPDAFDPNKADFSGMSDSKDLYISKIIHKSFIDVNEKGSEAAAVTAVTISLTSAITNEVIFKANKPFMILIRDLKTNSILFMGTVINPLE